MWQSSDCRSASRIKFLSASYDHHTATNKSPSVKQQSYSCFHVNQRAPDTAHNLHHATYCYQQAAGALTPTFQNLNQPQSAYFLNFMKTHWQHFQSDGSQNSTALAEVIHTTETVWRLAVKVVFKRWRSCGVHDKHGAQLCQPIVGVRPVGSMAKPDLVRGSEGKAPCSWWHINIWC